MSRRAIPLLLINLLFSISGIAQSAFVETQQKILQQSETQWICLELKSVNKSHFDCSSVQHSWNFPDSDTLLFCGKKIYVAETEREIFRELLFPDGSCERYLTLVSLCDLYFPLFRKKTEEAGLHGDYKYLPILLSGCNQNYDSNGRSGLWALDYLVARRVHLRVDSLIDERNGGDFTTVAALSYFAELEAKFGGDSFASIGAYRLGTPALTKLRDSSANSVFDKLPENEKSSIRFLAYVKALIESTRTQNQLQNYFDVFAMYEGVVMEKETQVEALKQVLGLNLDVSGVINPVFVGSRIPPLYRKVPYLLPVAMAGNWRIQKDSIARWRPAPPVVQVDTATTIVYHTVRRGESLGSIAKKHHTTIRKIKSLNKLKSDKIRQGQRLIVARQNAADKTLEVPETMAESKPKEDSRPKKKKEEAGTITYKVKNGDSLWKIASKYKGVSAEDIKRWNKCGDDLRPGQKLIIHLPN